MEFLLGVLFGFMAGIMCFYIFNRNYASCQEVEDVIEKPYLDEYWWHNGEKPTFEDQEQ